jgi:hypothetical protein
VAHDGKRTCTLERKLLACEAARAELQPVECSYDIHGDLQYSRKCDCGPSSIIDENLDRKAAGAGFKCRSLCECQK